MTALRQQAQEMFDSFPDEKMIALIQFMEKEQQKKESSTEEKSIDFDELKSIVTETHASKEEAKQKELQELERQEREIKAFGERMAKKYGLKENADEIQESIDRIKGALSSMSESDKNKSIKEWREERLREKYAEYFN